MTANVKKKNHERKSNNIIEQRCAKRHTNLLFVDRLKSKLQRQITAFYFTRQDKSSSGLDQPAVTNKHQSQRHHPNISGTFSIVKSKAALHLPRTASRAPFLLRWRRKHLDNPSRCRERSIQRPLICQYTVRGYIQSFCTD